MKISAENGHISSLAYVHGGELTYASLKSFTEDFIVEEVLGYEPEGQGEHIYLWVECRNQNTTFVARHLAKIAGVELKAVTYSGLKDRYAVTRQWFGIHLPGKAQFEPDQFSADGIQVLRLNRHSKKLRRGVHRSNQFEIRLRDIPADQLPALNSKIAAIFDAGVPNYFGPQRFGHNESNIAQAIQAVQSKRKLNREQRDRVYSTLRSFLFNDLLSERIKRGEWNRLIAGDFLMLAGRNSFFTPEHIDAELETRLKEKDVIIGGILPGKGSLPWSALALSHYEQFLEAHSEEISFLIGKQVDWLPRPTVLYPEFSDLKTHDDGFTLCFSLPTGSFATTVLREVFELDDKSTG